MVIVVIREVREMCRRGKYGGYFDIVIDSDSEEVR